MSIERHQAPAVIAGASLYTAPMTDWLPPTLGPAASILIMLATFRRSVPVAEQRLKHDIELLKLAKDAGLRTDMIEARVNSKLANLFPSDRPPSRWRLRLLQLLKVAIFISFVAELGMVGYLLRSSYQYYLQGSLRGGIVFSLMAGSIAFTTYIQIGNTLMIMFPAYRKREQEKYRLRQEKKSQR